MGCVVKLTTPGRYLAMFHDDGRFITESPHRVQPESFRLFKTFSDDGGLTWSNPAEVWKGHRIHLCEPGAIRSPDGKTLAILLRENTRRRNSHVLFSTDEGATFSEPRELPAALTGDRHTGVYLPDGRLFVSFRDRSPAAWESPTEGDWVAWVGTWDDLVEGREGQYRVRAEGQQTPLGLRVPGRRVVARRNDRDYDLRSLGRGRVALRSVCARQARGARRVRGPVVESARLRAARRCPPRPPCSWRGGRRPRTPTRSRARPCGSS